MQIKFLLFQRKRLIPLLFSRFINHLSCFLIALLPSKVRQRSFFRQLSITLQSVKLTSKSTSLHILLPCLHYLQKNLSSLTSHCPLNCFHPACTTFFDE